MNPFDPTNAGNRERPEPGDPEAPFYPPFTPVGDQENPNQGGAGPNYGYGPGYRPDMDPDGFANGYGGWRGRPGWQPWAGGGYYRRRRHGFWPILLMILLVALLIKPVLTFTFALAGLAFVILFCLLPFVILGLILSRAFGWRRPWGGGWGRW